MTRLSILIPCLHGAEQSEETLISVLQNRPAECEVLIPHAIPYADPYQLEGEVRFLHVAGEPGIPALINAAIERAEGDVIHTLSCGSIVEEGWTEPALAHFADPKVGAVSPLVIQRQQPTRIESLGVSYSLGGSTRLVGANQPLPQRHKLAPQVVGPTLQAGFYSRELLDALGGLSPEVGDDLADVDLALSLTELGYRTVSEPSCKVYGKGEGLSALRDGAWSRGKHLERLFLRHAAAQGGIWAVLAHPLAILADAWREFPSPGAALVLLGRIVASWEFGTIQAYKQRLAEAVEYLACEPTLDEARQLIRNESAWSDNPPEIQQRRKAA